MSTPRTLFLAAAWGMLLAAPAFAQVKQHKPAPAKSIQAQPVPAQPPAARPEAPEAAEGGADRLDLDTLRERYRPSIHPGDPLVIVGLEQGDNDLRSSTPTLARGDLAPQLVDTNEAYLRALAMYGDNQLFHSPPRPALGAEPVAIEPRHRPARRTPATSEPKPEKPEAAPWSVLSGLLVSALLIVWFLVRVRPALIAPKEASASSPEPEPFVWNPVKRAAPRPKFDLQGPAAPLPGPAHVAQEPRQR